MSDYDRLSEWLRLQTSNRVNATFTQIERILSFDLPYSARTFPQWWENDPKHMQGKTWMGAGFRTLDVNLVTETVAFVRRQAGLPII